MFFHHFFQGQTGATGPPGPVGAPGAQVSTSKLQFG